MSSLKDSNQIVFKSFIRYYSIIIIWDISNDVTCMKSIFVDKKKHKMEIILFWL